MLTPKEISRRFSSRLGVKSRLGRTLIDAAIGSAGLRLAFTGIRFVTVMLMARLLEPAGYGVYSFAMTLAGLLAIPSELGVPTLATREVAITNAQKDWGHMRGFIRWAHKITGLFTTVLMVLGASALWLWRDRMDPVQLHSIALAFCLVPMLSLAALRNSMLRGLRKVVLSQVPERIIKPLIVLVALFVLMLVGREKISPSSMVAVQIGASTIAFGFGLYWFLRNRPPELQHVEPSYRSRSWLKSTLPFSLMAAMQTINGQTDILALGIFREDAEIGIYRVAAQLATTVIFGLQIVNMIQAPHIAHMYAQKDMPRLQRMITKSSRGMLLITLPVVLVLVLFGEVIIRLAFGAAYEKAYVPLVILCVGQLVNASIGSVRSILNMTGNEHDTTRVLVIGAIANLLLSFTLTPVWGMNGAAVATTVTLILWNVLMWRSVRTRTGLESSPFFRSRR